MLIPPLVCCLVSNLHLLKSEMRQKGIGMVLNSWSMILWVFLFLLLQIAFHCVREVGPRAETLCPISAHCACGHQIRCCTPSSSCALYQLLMKLFANCPIFSWNIQLPLKSRLYISCYLLTIYEKYLYLLYGGVYNQQNHTLTLIVTFMHQSILRRNLISRLELELCTYSTLMFMF